jgi:PleD family two-component response regulator
LTERADQAMYAAKVKGRNCVMVSEPAQRLVVAKGA